jgi:uncharacterized membrane protein YkvA (DUF1232 family)
MLYRLLKDICRRIEALDIEAETPKMLREIERARPDLKNRLDEAAPNADVRRVVENAIAVGALNCVKGVPAIVDTLVGALKSRRESPQIKCGIAGVLCYLVQPRDLIPDDAPGGYGFVDDSVLLRAGLVQFLKVKPSRQWDIDQEVKFADMAASLVSPQMLPTLQQAVAGVFTTFELLQMLPSPIANMTLQQAIANPLQLAAPAAPPGFAPSPPPSYGGGRWSGGAYFEGGNVVIPGGPSLIDGNLFIP